MGNVGKSRNFSIRLSTGLYDQMVEELEKYHEGMNKTEFISDALKFYLRDLQDRRQWKDGYIVKREIDTDEN